jgi:hypothetical protein
MGLDKRPESEENIAYPFWHLRGLGNTERRGRYGKTDSMGDFSHHSQGKCEKAEEAYLDGLLQ